MKYKKILRGVFLRRPNRFVAEVFAGGKIHTVHVKNTGRCKELLVPQATVFLEESENPSRKTKFDLVAVEKKIFRQKKESVLLVNMDSLAPNKVCAEWISSCKSRYFDLVSVKSEFVLGDSRFDFLIQYNDKNGNFHRQILEVKGCTLEENGAASFPDAPTLRGLKHVSELSEIAKSGTYECAVLFVLQMKGCVSFSPNSANDPKFSAALKNAGNCGVEILAIECEVAPDSIFPLGFIPVIL